MTIQKSARISLICSAAVILIALIMTFCGVGLNFGFDFAGGQSLRYNLNQSFEDADIQAILSDAGVSQYRVLHAGTDGQELQITVQDKGAEQAQGLLKTLSDALAAKYPQMDAESAKALALGPAEAASLPVNLAFCVLGSAILLFAFAAFRLGLSAGLASVLALLHDALLTVSLAALLRFLIPVNMPFVGAFLATLAFSAGASLLTLSRIRDDRKRDGIHNLSRTEGVKATLKDSRWRILLTTGASLVIVLALCVFGSGSIRELCLPLGLGILVSTYAANHITGYVWACLEDRRSARKDAKKKAKKRK